MHIDYEYSDLSDDEIQQHIEVEKKERQKEHEQYNKRIEKAHNFRFVAGFC